MGTWGGRRCVVGGETPTSVENMRRQVLLLVTHSCTRTQFLSAHWGVQLVVAHITSTRQIQDQFSSYHRILEAGNVLVQTSDFVLFGPLESESCTVIKTVSPLVGPVGV